MIIDQTGTLANVKRHDYLPFGEELFAPTGGRTTALRQQFTQKERDIETGLDYFEARYYAAVQGRFVGADDPFADWSTADPQRWNLYSYTSNNPTNFVDPNGEDWAQLQASPGVVIYQWFDNEEKDEDEKLNTIVP